MNYYTNIYSNIAKKSRGNCFIPRQS